MLKSRTSRNIFCGVILVAAAFLAVRWARGIQKPWISQAPPYRQKGSPDAAIALVEFSDFQCPSCAYAVETVKRICALYAPDVRVIFKHYPWHFHPLARSASLAAECAGRQGKFWEYHDWLYLKQQEWSTAPNGSEIIESYAGPLRLDKSTFQACLRDPQVAALIDADMREADEHWVHSTPTFFVNGRRFVGSAQLRTAGVRMIERSLARKLGPR